MPYFFADILQFLSRGPGIFRVSGVRALYAEMVIPAAPSRTGRDKFPIALGKVRMNSIWLIDGGGEWS